MVFLISCFCFFVFRVSGWGSLFLSSFCFCFAAYKFLHCLISFSFRAFSFLISFRLFVKSTFYFESFTFFLII
jgi:hypothetical protein